MCQSVVAVTHETRRTVFGCCVRRITNLASLRAVLMLSMPQYQVNSHVGFKARLLSYIPHDVRHVPKRYKTLCLRSLVALSLTALNGLFRPVACGPTSGILKQTNRNLKPKSQTVKAKLQNTASFPSFSAIRFKVSGFCV